MTIDPPSPLTLNSLPAVVAAAVRGAGSCYVPAHHVAGPIAAGALVPVLGAHAPRLEGHCLYYPRTRHPTRAFGAFLAYLRDDRGVRVPTSEGVRDDSSG
ncbi:LysR substrate-binding domain-containing protein (plasmid) [Methylobacterium sp. NMS12]|uniref:LysR substrate-binding domain-containing protein n=1 Tax=Methylobacterium sp. NMS12 TaxID=3079766 RepID=UPI003F880F07